MLDSLQKRKVNKILYHRATLIVLAVLTIFIVRSAVMVYQKKLESEELKKISLNYKDSLEKRATELNYQINTLQTDAGREAEIRSKFSVAKEKENIVVIMEEVATTSPIKANKGIWQSILNWFR